MYQYFVITLHGRKKYQIVFGNGAKHLAYVNDEGEAIALIRHLNRKMRA